ncbi:calcium uniporter protein, mitochondrial [Anopheles aquasalis]|uniref:calcium uniporter protein, mitochondrial n=1 Tax=Anopheles aquasalis TaxID=42839 RepID=UPI00215B5808|nr:calcium uniporter protein, mitochondrial [Anopheles aquasalis]XP_050097973.1 calcium uniporter protein, mitochondrial [Anopheles aquasalis]XP_050097974.1 calcium uniporter protein, mitochondrial [Anopheles aquasalis]XP_050097975.1 calcium uniporter protein, mitochondrial [Anopheles aquasalis]XP_050097976.1 calcium uniporter protein, mitochondrial [Anopheles aquasalis]
MANPGSLRHLLRCFGSSRLVLFGGSEPLSRPLPGSLVNGLARNQSTSKNVSIRGSSRLYCTVSAATSGYSNNRGNSYRSSKRNSFIRSAIGHHEYSTATSSSTASSSSSSSITPEDVTVRYYRGLPHVTVPLPSRNERCQFTLRPVTHCVGDFIEMLKVEDRGIDRAAILNRDGVRIAAACSIENLMDDEFWLHLNDRQYYVKPPKREKITSEEITRLGDVQALVAQLYEALHVGEHQVKKERELNGKLEELNEKLGPLELKKTELDQKAGRRTNALTWVGLGLMSVQFGVLARLTWWEYSWDIMEPVTYFVTYGTAMAAYAYFVLTKQEYMLPDVKDRQHLITLHKAAKKAGINLAEYNDIKRQIAEIEHDLRRLRDPLYMHLPAPPPKSRTFSASEIAFSKKQQAAAAAAAAATALEGATASLGNTTKSKH